MLTSPFQKAEMAQQAGINTLMTTITPAHNPQSQMQPIPEMITEENTKKKRHENPNIHGIINNYFHLMLLLSDFGEWDLPSLLDSDRLGQVPWEVDIQISKNGKPVGDEL